MAPAEMMPSDAPAILTISETADVLRVSTRTVRRLAHARELDHYRIAGRILFDARDVQAYLERNRVTGAAS
jgi:excisionase family DNA binding protein